MSTAAMMGPAATDDWGTPREFFAGLDHEFRFELDVAASAANAKCDRFYSIEDDGLTQPWAPAVCWMNPPYGRSIGLWVAKAWHESTLGATVVGLLPARTDTAWWHDYIERRAEVRFVRGRLRFYGVPKDAPFPSAIAIWRPPHERSNQVMVLSRRRRLGFWLLRRLEGVAMWIVRMSD